MWAIVNEKGKRVYTHNSKFVVLAKAGCKRKDRAKFENGDIVTKVCTSAPFLKSFQNKDYNKNNSPEMRDIVELYGLPKTRTIKESVIEKNTLQFVLVHIPGSLPIGGLKDFLKPYVEKLKSQKLKKREIVKAPL